MKSTSPNTPTPYKLLLFIHFIEGLLPNVGIDEDSVTALGFDFDLTPKRLAWEKHTLPNYHKTAWQFCVKTWPFLMAGELKTVTMNSKGLVTSNLPSRGSKSKFGHFD